MRLTSASSADRVYVTFLVYSDNQYPDRIILSGLTACGKSTQAKRLAAHYGLRYVPMRPIMRAVSEGVSEKAGSESVMWTPQTDMRRARDDRIDREADRRMMDEIATGAGVFDAWALPWLYKKDDAVRVWIEADLASRVERCRVSFSARGEDEPCNPASLVSSKDEFTRRQLRRLYGIELGPDPAVFDVIIENSKPMTDPTPLVAEREAEVFSRVLVRAIEG